jgi:hypothetical protein
VSEDDLPEVLLAAVLESVVQSGSALTLARADLRGADLDTVRDVLRAGDMILELPGEDEALLLLPGLSGEGIWSVIHRVAGASGQESHAITFRTLTYPTEVPSERKFLEEARKRGLLPKELALPPIG